MVLGRIDNDHNSRGGGRHRRRQEVSQVQREGPATALQVPDSLSRLCFEVVPNFSNNFQFVNSDSHHQGSNAIKKRERMENGGLSFLDIFFSLKCHVEKLKEKFTTKFLT